MKEGEFNLIVNYDEEPFLITHYSPNDYLGYLQFLAEREREQHDQETFADGRLYQSICLIRTIDQGESSMTKCSLPVASARITLLSVLQARV